jgi:hypothetical protein
MYREIQNKNIYLADNEQSAKNMGLDMVTSFDRQLQEEARKLITNCDDANFRSKEVFQG